MMLPIPHFGRIVKQAHRHYLSSQIRLILKCLLQLILPYGAISRIAAVTGILKQTLSDWSHHRRDPKTPNWFSLEGRYSLKSALGPAVEGSLTDHLRANYIITGKGTVQQMA
jgi:hypothetical protein